MATISGEGMPLIQGIISRVQDMADPMSQFGHYLRKHLLETNQIMKIEDASSYNAEEISLATVDGGSVLSQLAFADLVVTGATLGEGHAAKKVYDTDDEYPALSFVQLVQHSSENAKNLPSGVMASQEISLLGHIPHDIKVADGAWLSGLTSVFICFLKSEEASAAILSSALVQRAKEGWDGFELVRGIDRLISPWRYTNDSSERVAMSKSDSSRVWYKRIKEAIGPELAKFGELDISDRILASLVLHPGEMLRPTYIDAGRSLVSALGKPGALKNAALRQAANRLLDELTEHEIALYSISHIDDMDEDERADREGFILSFVQQILDEAYYDDSLPREDRSPIERLKELDSNGGTWIWATYFKPTLFGMNQSVLRLEFSRDHSEFDDVELDTEDPEEWDVPSIAVNPRLGGFDDVVIPKAKRLVSIINNDVVDAEILEPWAQYVADIKAKDVSTLAEMVRSTLIGGLTDERLIAGLVRGYRT